MVIPVQSLDTSAAFKSARFTETREICGSVGLQDLAFD